MDLDKKSAYIFDWDSWLAIFITIFLHFDTKSIFLGHSIFRICDHSYRYLKTDAISFFTIF